MKKLLSIVLLLCIVMSMCTVSAWAVAVDPNGVYITVDATDGLREFFSLQIKKEVSDTYIANSKFEMRLFCGTTLMSLTTPKFGTHLGTGYPISNETTCAIWAYGQDIPSSWNTVWYEPLSTTNQPDNYILTIDDNIVVKGALNYREHNDYTKFTCVTMPFAVRTKGIVTGYYNSIDEAMNVAGDESEVFIRQTGELILPDGGGRNITFIGSVNGIVVNMQNKDNNYGSQTNFINIGVINQPTPVVPPAPVNPPSPDSSVVPAAPVVEDIYYIPATDDNSNMALWSILALALLSTAFVTRKRKSEN